MLKIHDVTDLLESKFPLEAAYEWDNVGLQIGAKTKTIQRVMVALEATTPVIDEAIRQEVDLIITHHPFIFTGLKEINFATPKGKNIEKLIKNDIALYSMHTNYDIADGGMNDVLADILKIHNCDPLLEDGLGRVGDLENPVNLEEFSCFVKGAFNLEKVSVIQGNKNLLKRVAVIGGAGGDYIHDAKAAGADVFLTGDIKYHTAIDAQEIGLNLIDIGHYAEVIMEVKVMELLQEKFGNQLNVLVPTVTKNPIE